MAMIIMVRTENFGASIAIDSSSRIFLRLEPQQLTEISLVTNIIPSAICHIISTDVCHHQKFRMHQPCGFVKKTTYPENV